MFDFGVLNRAASEVATGKRDSAFACSVFRPKFIAASAFSFCTTCESNDDKAASTPFDDKRPTLPSPGKTSSSLRAEWRRSVRSSYKKKSKKHAIQKFSRI